MKSSWDPGGVSQVISSQVIESNRSIAYRIYSIHVDVDVHVVVWRYIHVFCIPLFYYCCISSTSSGALGSPDLLFFYNKHQHST